MTDEKKNHHRSRYNSTSFLDPAQIREQAELKAKAAPLPDLDTMTREELRQMVHELQVKQIEAGLQNEQLRSQLEQHDSQAELLAAINALSTHLAIINEAGKIIAVNKAWDQFAHLNSAVFSKIGKGVNYLDICNNATGPDADIAAAFAKGMRDVLDGEKTEFAMEYPCHSNMDQRWFIGRVTPFSTNEKTGLVVAHENITDRKQAEVALKESHELLDPTQRLAHVGGWEWYVERQAMTWSDETYRIHGMSPGIPPAGSPEHIDMSLACYDPADRPVIETAFRRCAEEGQPYDLELRLNRTDGRRIWIRTQAQAIQNAGRVVRVTGTIMDITERKRAENKLRESEKKYRFMTEQMNDVVWTSDLEMRITYISPSDERILGFTPEERMKHTLVDMLAPFSQKKAMEVISKEYALDETGSIDSRRSISIELEYRHKDGSTRWLETLATGIRDDEGRLIGLHGVSRDITERKRAEQALRESEEKHRRLFETMAQGVIYQEADSGIISANPAAERILGLSFGQMRGMTSMDLNWKMIKEDGTEVPGPERPAMIALRTGETIGPVIRGVFHPGKNTYVWLTITAIPLFQPGETKPFQAYSTFEDFTEHKQAIEELKEREAFIKATLDNLPVGVAVNSVDPEVHFTYMNENFAKFYRTTREALDEASDFWEVVYTDAVFREEIKKRVLEDCASNDSARMYWEDIPISRSGKKPFYITAKNIPLPESHLMVSTVWDVTERKLAEKDREKLQAQLNQAQKMESVGRLAGGVAHDFNNKLSVINGYAELAMETIDPSDPLHETIQEIHTAGKHSADIVRQLLAFARKQTISPILLDLNDIISSMLKMLQRLIGEDIDLTWHPGNNLWFVKMDPSQVDQVIANLAVNSRDAIPDVGKLTIETKNTIVDEDYCKSDPEAIPGRYVMLAVSDDGCGIEEEIKEQLFDPYFTTKEIGKGTGLGLPTVYGIVKQNNGFINLYSEPGEGTTFKLYFPSHEEAISSLHSAKESSRRTPTGTETVLVVEDENTILQMSKQMLERLGYTVETAASAAEALQISDEYDGTIHLLITDVIMPEMNGRDLSSQLVKSHPDLKTLYMSGYTANVIAHHGVLDEGVQFIQKPFSLKDLAKKVREVIEQG